MDRRLFGWGLFFILVGAIPLAVRAGVLDSSFVSRWPALWPFLLVGGGIGLLLRRTPVEWVGGAIVALTLGIMGGGALASGFAGIPAISSCGSNTPGTAFATRTGTLADGGRLNVEFSCGTLNLTGGSTAGWSVSGSGVSGRAPEVKDSPSGTTITTPTSVDFLTNSGRNDWNVQVGGSHLALGLTLNAGTANANLGSLDLSSLSMTLNAGSMDVDLTGNAGTFDVNASVNAGHGQFTLPSTNRHVNVSLNAGDVSVCLAATPDGTRAFRVKWSGALGANNFDELGLTKVDDSTWTSNGFNPTSPHTELDVSANAGKFDLQLAEC